MSVTVTLTQNAESIVRRLDRMPQSMTAAIIAALDAQNDATVGHIQETKLSAAGPRYLNVRSGRLRKSARRTAAKSVGAAIVSSIGSNVKYARAHEDGFQGEVEVGTFSRRFARRVRVGDKSVSRAIAQGLGLYDGRGRLRRRKGVAAEQKEGPVLVKAHKRKMNLRARRMFRDGIAERIPAYRTAISAAIVRAWAGGAE